MALEPIDLGEWRDSPFRLFAKDWALFTAGTLERWNTMTIGWGGLGVLWSRPVCWAYLRPSRHTFGFAERAERFSLSFFDESWRSALQLCGTVSGRDTDKAAETGLRAGLTPGGAVYFRQARLVLDCRKLYAQDLSPSLFLDPDIARHYPEGDFHRLYVGGIEAAWNILPG